MWFILECRHGPFPLAMSCYRKEVKPPQNFSLVGVHRSRFEYGALKFVLVISPSYELEIRHRFFFMDLFLFKEHSIKISDFFLNWIDWLGTGSAG